MIRVDKLKYLKTDIGPEARDLEKGPFVKIPTPRKVSRHHEPPALLPRDVRQLGVDTFQCLRCQQVFATVTNAEKHAWCFTKQSLQAFINAKKESYCTIL